MKKKIEDALRTEYAGLGLSDKTFGRLADYLQGSVEKEEDIATAVKRDDVKLMATSIQGEIDGIKRAKEAAENALADYKAKHPESKDDNHEDGEKNGPQSTADIAQVIADAISKAVAPLTEKIQALENSTSAKEATSSARETFFGGDYAKKYKEQAEDAWDRAVEMNEATGSKMTADELMAKATTYFNRSVARIGVDTSVPFVPDKDPNNDEGTTDWSAEVARLKANKMIPSEV